MHCALSHFIDSRNNLKGQTNRVSIRYIQNQKSYLLPEFIQQFILLLFVWRRSNIESSNFFAAGKKK